MGSCRKKSSSSTRARSSKAKSKCRSKGGCPNTCSWSESGWTRSCRPGTNIVAPHSFSVCAAGGAGFGAGQGCLKLLDFSLSFSSIGWRRGLGRGGAFLLVSPLLGPLPARSSRGEDGELDAAPSTPQLRAFSLVELLVVIAIVAILASLALPVLQAGHKKRRLAH